MAGTTQEQFAHVVGITQPAVSDLLRRGVLSRKGNLLQWVKEYTAHLREQAAGRAPQGDTTYDLVTERARLSARQAEKLEIELARTRGELLPTDAVVEGLTFTTATIRTKLLAVPSRYKSICPRLTPKEIDALDNLIRETLTELGNVHFPASIEESARRYFSQLHAAAQADGEPVGGQIPGAEPGVGGGAGKVEDEPGTVS